jgi:protein kinase-like protein/PEGA domain-containing protein
MDARRKRPWLVLPLTLLAVTLLAQEWHEAYRDGVRALSAGQTQRAVSLLEYAVSQRPQPGRNVITYGTNVEPRYYPYLRLAEAYLRLNDVAGARSALARSERWGNEPAAERTRLAAQVEEAAARAAPATPTPAPPVAATPLPPPPTTVAAPERVPEAPPAPAPAIPTPTAGTPPARGPRAAEPPRSTAPRPSPPAGVPEHPSHPPSAPAEQTCSLEIVSQPPGAAVYLDDELIGTTDPEWGRLLKSGVPPGRHRLRLSKAGYVDVVEELELGAGALGDFRRRLPPAEGAFPARGVLFAAVALVLLALTAWSLRRPRPAGPLFTPARLRSPEGTPTPARATPGGFGSPGVVRDAQGVDRFGEYRLLEPLGRGGMASVYKAERRGEVYALKRPLPAFLEEPEFLERFLREAEIGRTLHHPNIVRILERGEVGGVPYFTMELVAGETLQSRLQRGGFLEPRAAAGLVAQVAEALDYAHLKGVVHRDLKPSNIMVLADGTARVMDYGIARARRFEGLTVTGAFLGSPEYVAPETIDGNPTDARSDLYSLGVVFYETLTGRRPFTADTPFAILRKHLNETPVRPTLVRPGLPPELEKIALRLLNKRPEDRYAGADELVIELRDFLNRTA